MMPRGLCGGTDQVEVAFLGLNLARRSLEENNTGEAARWLASAREAAAELGRRCRDFDAEVTIRLIGICMEHTVARRVELAQEAAGATLSVFRAAVTLAACATE